MKNLKVKKILTAIGAVMALGLAAQSQAQVAAPSDTTDLDATADYAAFNVVMGAFCALPADAAISDAPQAGYCLDDGRTYNAVIPVIPTVPPTSN